MSSQPPLPKELCFLSEFDRPGLRWMADHPGRVAGLFAGWALMVLWLGDQVGANGMAIYYAAEATLASGVKVSSTAANMYGHLSTANSGLYYLLISPWLMLLTYHFHLAAGRAFIQLEERGILRTSGEPWQAIIQRRNGRVGRCALWLFILFVPICFYKQFSSLYAGRDGLPVFKSGDETQLVEWKGWWPRFTFWKRTLLVSSEGEAWRLTSKKTTPQVGSAEYLRLLYTYEGKMLWVPTKGHEPLLLSKRLNNVGYNQSPNHQRWVDDFNKLSAQESRLRVLEAQEISVSGPLSQKLFAELDRKNLLNPKCLEENPKLKAALDFHEGKPVALRLQDAVKGESPVVRLTAENVWPKQPRVKIWKITDYFQSLLDTRGKEDGERGAYMFWFSLFVILDQVRIAALFTFMTWLLVKFTFYLVLIYRMLPMGVPAVQSSMTSQGRTAAWRCACIAWFMAFIFMEPYRIAVLIAFIVWLLLKAFRMMLKAAMAVPRQVLFLEPWARDGQGKFGLGDLFTPYNLLVLCIGVGSFYFALNFPEGGGLKAITQSSGAGLGTTRVFHLLTVGAAIAGMLIGPLLLYPRRLRQWLEVTRLHPLRERQAKTREKRESKPLEAEKEWAEIAREEAEILSQTTWPKGDKSFQLSMLVIFTVLLLPLGTASDFLPEGVTKYSRLPQYLRAECKELAAWVYDLYPAEEISKEP
jgi:hypothetical protein